MTSDLGKSRATNPRRTNHGTEREQNEGLGSEPEIKLSLDERQSKTPYRREQRAEFQIRLAGLRPRSRNGELISKR
jgi:hypothetical protein